MAAVWVPYTSIAWLNLGAFCRIACLLTDVFGTAIPRHVVDEFEEVEILPPLVEQGWNDGVRLLAGMGFGATLPALIRCTPTPSLTQLVAYAGFLSAVGLALGHP